MLFFDFFSRKRSSNQQHPNSLSFQTFILEPILTPSGIIDGPGDDTIDIDGIDSDLPDLDDLSADALNTAIADDLDIIPYADSPVTIADIDSGVFTVGDTGQVSIDFLYDGGGYYKGQLAIFSLDGMENLDLDSPEFIQEAANRALSNSNLGHIVIDDATEGARFSGKTDWEGDFNSGTHISDKTFTMRPGDTFAVMLVPNGKVEQVANNPDIGGSVRPLFSLATANPDDAFHVGQIADVTGDGNTFVMEDRRIDGWTDQDYNDIIFRVTGATGEAEEVDNLIADGKDWRSLPSMQELFQHIVDPEDLAGNTPEEALRSSVSSAGKPYRGWVSSLDPDDYYSFTLGGRNELNLSLDGFSEDINVELLDINENVIFSSSNTGTTPESINATLNAGAYRVRVSSVGDVIPGTLYDLEMAVTPLIPGVTTTGSDELTYLFTDESSQLINLDDFRLGNSSYGFESSFVGIDGSGWSTVIIDTGIDLDHPYFGPDANGDGISDRIILDPNAALDFADNDLSPADVNDHGSHVASIAASSGRYSGVAPGAKIIPLKVFSDNGGGASYADIEQALQWTIENATKFNIASVNLSLGSGNYNLPFSPGLSDEFQALADLGVISVAASGNSFFQFRSNPGVSFPSSDPNVISVGAVFDENTGYTSFGNVVAYTTDADRIAPFSQRHGTLTDIFAPGVNVIGADATGGTVAKSGTSMASPHIAGMAVLAQQLAVQELGRRLTPDEFRRLLNSTGTVINDGDDENDNVNNTGLNFRRADMLKLGEAIANLHTPELSGKYFNVVQEPRDAGDRFTTQFEVQNTQPNSSSGSFNVDFYISTNDYISKSDRYLGSYSISNLLGNRSTGILTKTLTLPGKGDSFWDRLEDGTYYIGMIVDSDGDVAEINENNNQNTGSFKDYDAVQINDTQPLINAWSHAGKLDTFTQQISDKWDQGYDLVDVEYGDGRWFGVYGADQGRNAWSYAGKLDTFTQQISDKWDQGYNLIDVEHGDGLWFGVYGADQGRNAWSYASKLDTFAQKISDRWDQGYELVDMERGDGVWFGIFADDKRPNGYYYASKLDTFEQRISDQWDQGQDLIDVEHGDGSWFGVFGGDRGRNAWSHASKLDTFTQQISDRWDQGYELIDVGYGDGRWFGVFMDD